jgi:hypothetical protein
MGGLILGHFFPGERDLGRLDGPCGQSRRSTEIQLPLSNAGCSDQS